MWHETILPGVPSDRYRVDPVGFDLRTSPRLRRAGRADRGRRFNLWLSHAKNSQPAQIPPRSLRAQFPKLRP